jgi:hypothetical protein
MRPTRISLAVLAAAGAVLLLAGPLAAQTSEPETDRSFVVFTGRIDIAEGDVFQDAVIFDGDAAVAGDVVNNVVAFNGDVTVSGSVGENVVALNGRVALESGARVGGDVISRDPADVAEDATVGGQVTSEGLPTDFNLGRYVTISRIAIWFATSVSSLVLGLLLLLFAPRAGEAVAATATGRFGRSIGIGLAVFFGLPIAGGIAIATVIGIPLGLGILLGLALLFWIGYVAAALAIGRQLIKPPTSRLLAFLAGWAILRVIAIVPGIGGLVWFLVTVFGLGALVVAARDTGRETRGATPATGAVPVPPPPPMPPG